MMVQLIYGKIPRKNVDLDMKPRITSAFHFCVSTFHLTSIFFFFCMFRKILQMEKAINQLIIILSGLSYNL